ncbi:MAG: peptidylprolyl isomerase [Kouleothrix sp.]|nr:peptidylprolyl isomerase [Kouleothrix sp.]
MVKAQRGDTVKVHYTGRLPNETVFDSSRSREPLEFTIGAGEVIPGFELAVVGMQPGESKMTTITANEAYGSYDEDMILEVDRAQLPPDTSPEVGQQYQVSQQDGGFMVVTVTEVSDASVTLDANHPLAGQDLTFDIELMEIM